MPWGTGGATQREIKRITGISCHTIRSYQQRFAAADPANCPGVATASPSQTAPPWPPDPNTASGARSRKIHNF